MQIILGSQSPRRREILSYFNLPFKQISPNFDEDSIPFRGNSHEYVKLLAQGKAHSLIHQFPSSIILTADTIVYKDGKIYGKPSNKHEALRYLKELSGNWHSVFTGLVIYSNEKYFQASEETRILFHTLTEEQMLAYHCNIAFEDKAGGYMIQGAGSLIVKRIEGCYYNVMGLPINALNSALNQVGIDLWKHLKG
jgi:septum formation protein